MVAKTGAKSEIIGYITDHPLHVAVIIGGIIAVILYAHHMNAVNAAAQSNQAPAGPDPNNPQNPSPYGYPGQGYGARGGGGGGWWQKVLNVAGHYVGTGKNRTWVPATYTRQWE